MVLSKYYIIVVLAPISSDCKKIDTSRNPLRVQGVLCPGIAYFSHSNGFSHSRHWKEFPAAAAVVTTD